MDPRSGVFQYLWKLYAMFLSHGGVRPEKSVAYQLPSIKTMWLVSTSRMALVIEPYKVRSGTFPGPRSRAVSFRRSYPPIHCLEAYRSASFFQRSTVRDWFVALSQREGYAGS